MNAKSIGVLPEDAKKVWVTALDERVCPTCAPMDTVAVPVDDSFTVTTPGTKNRKANAVQLFIPPVHPHCRCIIVPEAIFGGQGIITRTSRFLDIGPHHKGKLTSKLEDLVIGKSLWDEVQHPRTQDGKFTDSFKDDAVAAGVTAAAVVGGGIVAEKLGVIPRLKFLTYPVKSFDEIYKNVKTIAAPNAKIRFALSIQGKNMPVLTSLDDVTSHEMAIFHPDAYQHLQAGSLQETLLNVEKAIKNKDVEHGFVIDPNGRILYGGRGDHHSTPLLFPELMPSRSRLGLTVTHNHPSGNPEEHVTLSVADIDSLVNRVGSMRAVNRDGTVFEFKLKDKVTKTQVKEFKNRAMQEVLEGQYDHILAYFDQNPEIESYLNPHWRTKTMSLSDRLKYIRNPEQLFAVMPSDDPGIEIMAKYQSARAHALYELEHRHGNTVEYNVHKEFAKAIDWEEVKHPRDRRGKFAEGAAAAVGGVGIAAATPTAADAVIAREQKRTVCPRHSFC
jgi:hypothetical protein